MSQKTKHSNQMEICNHCNLLEQRSSLPLLISTNLKMFASLDCVLGNMFATLALQPQHNLFGSFSLLMENGLCLSTITGLFPIITTLSLGSQTILALLILCNLVQGVFPAFL